MSPVIGWRRVAGAAAALAVCTSGPSFAISTNVFHILPSVLTWTYLFPIAAVGAFGVVALGRRLRGTTMQQVPWPLFAVGAFVAWTLLSVFWTVSPIVTPVNALLNVGIVAFACWFGWTVSPTEQIYAVAAGMTAPVVVSLLLVAWRPSVGRSPIPYVGASYGGDWIGIFANRNSLGAVAVLAIIGLCGALAVHPTVARTLFLCPLVAANLAALYYSNSDTGVITLGLCAVGFALTPALHYARRWRVPLHSVAAVTFLSLTIGWLWLFNNLDSLAARVGRDPTLSNRRTIWMDVRHFIAERPWKGFGYWAFWDQDSLTAATYARVGKYYASAHDSVLEILLMLGLVGLILYATVAAASIGGIARLNYYRLSVTNWWWSVLIVYLIAENLTESFVLWHSYNWILFVAAGFVPFGSRQCSVDRAPPTPPGDVGHGPMPEIAP